MAVSDLLDEREGRAGEHRPDAPACARGGRLLDHGPRGADAPQPPPHREPGGRAIQPLSGLGLPARLPDELRATGRNRRGAAPRGIRPARLRSSAAPLAGDRPDDGPRLGVHRHRHEPRRRRGPHHPERAVVAGSVDGKRRAAGPHRGDAGRGGRPSPGRGRPRRIGRRLPPGRRTRPGGAVRSRRHGTSPRPRAPARRRRPGAASGCGRRERAGRRRRGTGGSRARRRCAGAGGRRSSPERGVRSAGGDGRRRRIGTGPCPAPGPGHAGSGRGG